MSDRLQEIRARLDAASPGLWIPGETAVWNLGSELPIADNVAFSADVFLIAHAPADIAWLLDEVERLRTENGTELLRDDSVAQGVTNLQRGAGD